MIHNHWYIGCASSQLDTKPVAATILDRQVVLFRDDTAAPHALLDRCVHRGVRLSLGTIANGGLACGYHGWRFDGAGQCVHIPSLVQGQRIAKGCQVPPFPTREQDGYVWVWIGDRDPGDAPPPAIPEFAARRWMQGVVPMKCSALRAIENNLDWCHPYFAHPKTHGQYFRTKRRGFQDEQYEIRVTESGLVLFAPVTAEAEQPIPDRADVRLTFELPDRVTVDFGGPERGASWREKLGAGMTIVMHFVPTGTSSCRLEWLVSNPMPFGGRMMWSKREPKIFEQDRVLLESSQPWYDAGGEFERSVEADTSTLLVRRIYDLAAQGSWEQHKTSLPRRRIVDVRA
jgi:phenylpropionate dioxygenase-like ring-hydroxylating dioxygenase large terminal subunit